MVFIPTNTVSGTTGSQVVAYREQQTDEGGLIPVICDPNPDIAGPGIILSFVIASLIGLAASTIEEATRPGTQITSNSIEPATSKSARARIAFQEALHTLVLTQLLNGFALLLSLFISYGWNFHDSHIILGDALVTLSLHSASTICIFLESAPRYKKKVHERALVLVFGTILVTVTGLWMIVVYNMNLDPKAFDSGEGWSKHWWWWVLFVLGPFTLLFLQFTWFEIRQPRRYFTLFSHQKSGISVLKAFGSLGVDVAGVLLHVGLCTFVLYLKYGDVPLPSGCRFRAPEEANWTLGQVLAVIMLCAPVYSAVETYRELRKSHISSASDDANVDIAQTEMGETASSFHDTDVGNHSQPSETVPIDARAAPESHLRV